jgi:ribosomal protein S18 acetylase RimI-like enzyme
MDPHPQKFSANAKTGDSVILESELLNPLSSEYPAKILELRELLTQAYVPVEVQFSRKHPNAIPGDKFLHSLTTCFEKGLKNVDWNVVESKTKSILHHFFADEYITSMRANKDVCQQYYHLLITAKNVDSRALIGAIYFLIPVENPPTQARVPVFGVSPHVQGQGIGKLLVSTLFKIYPTIKKIILVTRVTNDQAIKAYQSWGFTPSPKAMEYWAGLEYTADNTNKLQLTANSFKS